MNDGNNTPEDQLRQFAGSLGDAVSSFGKKVGGFVDDFFKEEESGEVSVRVDAYYTAEAFVIEAELPGVLKEDVSLQVVDQFLSLKGVKKINKDAEKFDYLGRERVYGHFLRTLELPTDIDLKKIKAKYENGILKVTFAKPAGAASKGDSVDIE